jgi:hypothetical protein
MRTTQDEASVRLYYLDDGGDGGQAQTLMYGPLSQALAMAAGQDAAMQDGLWIATSNDVIAYRDLVEE